MCALCYVIQPCPTVVATKYISRAGHAADQYGFGKQFHELWPARTPAALQVLSAIATQTSCQQEYGFCAEHASQQQSANGSPWPAVLHSC